MVCIEKRPYTLYGRLATLHFRYLTCLLDRGHISDLPEYIIFILLFQNCTLKFFHPITLKNNSLCSIQTVLTFSLG